MPTPLTSEQSHDDGAREVFGMWIFLATEIMFFGGLFVAYASYRIEHQDAFALGAAQTDLVLGSLNTAVLLTSSFTMALAMNRLERQRRTESLVCLVLTVLLGAAFLVLKGIEYYHDYDQSLVPGLRYSFAGAPVSTEMFFVLYFFMTGLHALHLGIGILVASYMWLMVYRRILTSSHLRPLRLAGLYWHFIDIVWVFLFPLLYLVPGSR